MYTLGRIFSAVFDGYLAAFGWLSPAASLVLLSLLLGLLMLYAFKWVGNPSALERSQARMQAHLMEMRLFDNEPRVVLRSMGRLLWWNLRFFFASLRPAVFATLPMVLLFVQMEHYYGVRALEPGETAVVTVELVGGEPTMRETIELAPTFGVARVSSPPVRARTRGPINKVSWQVRGLEPGVELMVLRVGKRTYGKTLHVAEDPTTRRQTISMRRVRRDSETLLYPIEPRLPEGPVYSIDVAYPQTDTAVLGFELHWLIWLVLVSVFGAFLLKWIVERFKPGALSPRAQTGPRAPPTRRGRVLRFARETVFIALAGVTVLLLWLMLRENPARDLSNVIEPAPPIVPIELAEVAAQTSSVSASEDEDEDPDLEGLRRPDVIMITVDTLRSDRVGAYGSAHVRTPAIDQIAQEGVVFEASTTAFPKTTPAMASLMTGLWPHHHGARDVWEKVEDGVFLAEILRDRGYQTVGVTSNSACGSRQHFDQGFDRLINRNKLPDAHADSVTDRALRLLKRARKNKPLFLWVHYVDPHWPYEPPRRETETLRVGAKCRALLRMKRRGKISHGQIVGNHENLSREAHADCSALYDTTVRFADREIGRLITALRERERWEDSIVVFTSDHGENFGEDGYYYSHGASLNDATMRVPLLMRGPGIPIGHVDRGMIQSEDVMPTLLQLLDVPFEDRPEMDGVDVSWRWNDKTPRPARAETHSFAESSALTIVGATGFLATGRSGGTYCVHDTRYSICERPVEPAPQKADEAAPAGEPETVIGIYDRAVDSLPRNAVPIEEVPPEVVERLQAAFKRWPLGTARSRMVRSERYKLVEVPVLEGGFRRELYDMSVDPSEIEDISASRPRTTSQLAHHLERWLTDQPLYKPAAKLSDEELSELKALGYIGD